MEIVRSKVRSLFSKLSPTGSEFQFLSDLHLEVGQQYSSYEIPVSAPYLILGGDIGRLKDYTSYLDFLIKQTERYEKVFLVLGNHEFYGLSFTAGLSEARRIVDEPALKGKLVLLDRTRYDVPECPHVVILGCTLWSKIPEDARSIISYKIQDFRRIEGWTVDDHNTAFESDSAWLRQQVAAIRKENDSLPKGQSKRILVVTHYAPAIQKTASPVHDGSELSPAFATDLLADGTWEGVHTWIFGHTHYTNEFEESGIKVVSNQRGYVFPGGMERKSDVKDKKNIYDVRKVIRI